MGRLDVRVKCSCRWLHWIIARARSGRKQRTAGLLRGAALSAGVTLLALSAIAGPVRAADRNDTHAAIKQRSAELSSIEAKIRDATKALKQARGRRGRLQGAVNAAEKKIARTRTELKAASDKTTTVEDKLRDARRKQTAMEAELTRQRHELARQLRAQYILGATQGAERLRLLVSEQDPALAGRLLTYYRYLGRARTASIQRVEAQLDNVNKLEAQIVSQQEALTTLHEQRKQMLAQLQTQQEKRAKAVNALKAKIDRKGAELDKLRASERQMKELLASLGKQLASAPLRPPQGAPFAKQQGRLLWPVHGPLLARYGALRAGGPLTWKGLWIGAKEGTPIRASAAGRVAYVGWLSSYGLIVLLEHDHGYFTLYGHAARADVRVGELVAAGQQIAAAGETGGYERSGVYFEIRHDSDAINPLSWLAH